MGFFYKKTDKETLYGVTFSVKFGKGSKQEDKAVSSIFSLVSLLKFFGFGVQDSVNTEFDKKLKEKGIENDRS